MVTRRLSFLPFYNPSYKADSGKITSDRDSVFFSMNIRAVCATRNLSIEQLWHLLRGEIEQCADMEHFWHLHTMRKVHKFTATGVFPHHSIRNDAFAACCYAACCSRRCPRCRQCCCRYAACCSRRCPRCRQCCCRCSSSRQAGCYARQEIVAQGQKDHQEGEGAEETVSVCPRLCHSLTSCCLILRLCAVP